MAEHSVHAVFVDGVTRGPQNHERLVRGFVTDLDLARAAASGPLDAEAGEVTASQIVTINPDETSGRAAQIMGEHDCSHLVVVSPEEVEPLGVTSSLEVARALVSRPPV
jgi:CBS domain-containing protein